MAVSNTDDYRDQLLYKQLAAEFNSFTAWLVADLGVLNWGDWARGLLSFFGVNLERVDAVVAEVDAQVQGALAARHAANDEKLASGLGDIESQLSSSLDGLEASMMASADGLVRDALAHEEGRLEAITNTLSAFNETQRAKIQTRLAGMVDGYFARVASGYQGNLKSGGLGAAVAHEHLKLFSELPALKELVRIGYPAADDAEIAERISGHFGPVMAQAATELAEEQLAASLPTPTFLVEHWVAKHGGDPEHSDFIGLVRFQTTGNKTLTDEQKALIGQAFYSLADNNRFTYDQLPEETRQLLSYDASAEPAGAWVVTFMDGEQLTIDPASIDMTKTVSLDGISNMIDVRRLQVLALQGGAGALGQQHDYRFTLNRSTYGRSIRDDLVEAVAVIDTRKALAEELLLHVRNEAAAMLVEKSNDANATLTQTSGGEEVEGLPAPLPIWNPDAVETRTGQDTPFNGV